MPSRTKRRSSMSSREEEKILDEYRRRIEDKAKKVEIQSRKKVLPISPYLQSVAPRNVSTFSKRPQSALVKPRRKRYTSFGSVQAQSVEARSFEGETNDGYSSTFDTSDSEDSNEKENNPNGDAPKPIKSILRNRPSSAPSHHRRHTHEGTVDTESVRSERKNVPVFQRQPITIRCTAYKNGSVDNGVSVVAADVKQLLIEATRKLGLNTAARRVYFSDGSEAFRAKDIPFNSEVFISCGELFKDPEMMLNDSGSLIASNSWTSKGVRLDSERKPVKRTLSTRLRHLAHKQSSRILIFQNGNGADGQEIIIGNQDGYPRLLDMCTSKLKMNLAARTTFGWDGREVSSIEEVRQLDSSMVNGSSLIMGPIWVSSGEGFKPSGALNFVEGILWGLQQRMQIAKMRSEQLEYACNGEMDKVSQTDIIVMQPDEIYIDIEQVNDHIEDMKKVKTKYKLRLKTLREMKQNQKEKGNSYSLQHIKEISSDDRIVGKHGLRLKIRENGNELNEQTVYINMREILRGAVEGSDSKRLIRMRFLEHLTHWHKPLDPSGPAKSTIVRRMFDEGGVEIHDIHELENEQRVYLSYGEDFKSPNTMVLQLQLQGVIGFETDSDRIVMRSEIEINTDTKWEVSAGFPNSYDFRRVSALGDNVETFSTSDHFLQSKDDPSLVARPSLLGMEKSERKSGTNDMQSWIIHRNGSITSRSNPQLALALDKNQPITVQLKCGTKVEGYAVSLQKKDRTDSAQCWEFSPTGQICSLYSPNATQVLTFLNGENFTMDEVKCQQSDDKVKVQGLNNQDKKSKEAPIAVLEKLSGSRARFQRWAFKQERVANQWKNTKVANPSWKKMAYSWPVLPDGNWNLDYQWPMDGTFLNAPPPLRCHGLKSDASTTVPVKVLRNGEKNPNRFATVVAPDLSSSTLANEKNPDQEMNVEKLEMNMFLEQATSLLNLPFAARRLFNERGVELLTVRKLKRQVVYVTCGEPWHNPRVTKSEGQRRQLLAKLTADVRKISEYCMLREPTDVVMAMESGPVIGSRLIATEQIMIVTLQKEEKENKQTEEGEGENESQHNDEKIDHKTAHQKAHESIDRWWTSKKYPWQREQNKEEETTLKEEEKKSPRSPKLKSRSPRVWHKDPALLQKFTFKDGFITPDLDPTLAVGLSGVDLETLSGSVEVFLCKRTNDDLTQRWEIGKDGFIRLACNHSMGLAVSMATNKNEEEPSMHNIAVVLQKLRPHNAGSANQKWHLDNESHLLQGYQTSVADKEVTAANHVSVCTHAVRGPEQLNQDGYIVEMSGSSSNNPVVVCRSCATVMRGRYSLTRVPSHWSFICAMGNAKKNGLKPQGSFCCLNGKVDLSTYEAEPTFTHWMGQLQRLQQETSVRSINRDLNNVECSQAWRLLVRRNGEGYLSKPEMVVGSSVVGVLDQCSHKLGLSSAARRLYTEDGTQILHMDQLKEWVQKVSKVTRHHEVRDEGNTAEEKDVGNTNDEKLAGNNVEEKNEKPNEGNNSTEGTPDHSTAEYGTQDLTRKGKKNEKATHVHTDVRPPEVPALPLVEIWVSCGENFIKPSLADKMNQENMATHVERNARNLAMDTQRHVVRQIHGRRRGHMNPRELVPTKDIRQPVLVSGGWEEPTNEENERIAVVNRIKEKQRPKRVSTAPRLQSNIYKQPQMKRIIVRALGDEATSVYSWGDSLQSLLDDASTRLGFRKSAKVFRTRDGIKIDNFEEIDRNAELYINPKRPGSTIKMKTTWARTRKAHGPAATEIVLNTSAADQSETYVLPSNKMLVTPSDSDS